MKLTFIAVERHPVGMEEAFPALALVLVQHESVADDGGALEGANEVLVFVQISPGVSRRATSRVAFSGLCVSTAD